MVSTTNERVSNESSRVLFPLELEHSSINSSYKGVEINDFTCSWQNGLAFNALIHKFRPDLFDYEQILRNEAAKNLEHAFTIGTNVFKIDRYLDVEG